jgi:hypothetical protein
MRQEPQAARPDGGKQRQAVAISEPPAQTGRRPEFVVEIWASPQLREQNPGRPLSLREALDAGRGPASRTEPELDPEPEAGP